jgi:HD-GYP domain-containing protein (c-di-GMP phosphodiesterase class II)
MHRCEVVCMTLLAELTISGHEALLDARRKVHAASLVLGAEPDRAATATSGLSDLLRAMVGTGATLMLRVTYASTGRSSKLTFDCVSDTPADVHGARTMVDREGWHAIQQLALPAQADPNRLERAGALLLAKTKEQLLEENNQLLRETLHVRTESLNRLASDLGSLQDLDTMLLRVLQEARATFRCEGGSLLLAESGRLRFRMASSGTSQSVEDVLLHSGEASFLAIDRNSLAGAAACDGLVVIRDAYDLPPDAPYHFNQEFDRRTGFRTRAVLAVSMRSSQGELLGVLQLLNPDAGSSDHDGEFAEDDVKLAVHFAGLASMAIERSGMTRALVLRMMRLAELRDPKETGAHVRRVSEVASRLYVAWARAHGLAEREILDRLDQLRPAAMLHDVGKVGIDDAILKAPGKLTPEQRRIMEQHTRIGAATLLGVRTAMDPAIRDVTLYHHARWDGTGYPSRIEIIDTLRGLGIDASEVPEPKGEAIPIFARVVAIADVFDALMSRRAYKDAWPVDAVRKEFESSGGSHFDPELVQLFLADFDDYVKLHSMISG